MATSLTATIIGEPVALPLGEICRCSQLVLAHRKKDGTVPVGIKTD